MKRTTDKSIKTGNNDFDNNVEKFVKWSKICTITAIVIGVFGIGVFLLTILKEFTDLEVKAPFLYSKIFGGILLAVVLVLFALHVFCCVKMRKYKKLIEEIANEENDNETNDR